jgi:hypothetical protein
MVGNKTRAGEIFTKDGTLDPEFVKFGNEYNRRMKAGGKSELGINEMAIEFYTDKAAEVLKTDIQSGEFTKRAQESKLSRTVKAHFSAIINQVPIIKNIHIKTGGAIDASGRLVKGSGLLSDGFTQSKDVQAMVRKMYRETAGISRTTKGIAQEGAAMRQPRATKSTREGINNGTSAVEKVNRESRAAGLTIPEGALDPSTVRGRDGVPTALQTKAIIDSGAIHPDHLGTFPMLVGEMNPNSTSTFLFHYRPAEQGRTIQSAAGETFHHIKPVGVRTNKKGNVLITALDVNLWDQNIKKVANSKPAKDLGYTEKQIRADSYEASKYHIKNTSPDAYFEQKYGKAQALKRKSLVASTYGEMTAKQRAYNPLLSEVGMGRPDNVYRTFSLDDIKSATRTNSSVNLSFDPNNYYPLKVNLMPEAPIVDRAGNIIENPAMKDFFENHLPNGQRFRASENQLVAPSNLSPEATSQVKMPENVKTKNKFINFTESGKKALNQDFKDTRSGSVLGNIRFMPESENARILSNFPIDESVKKKMEGKTGFAFTSDWSDSNRPYVTRNGRNIDVLLGGVGYTYHPEVIGKGGWAGSFSPLTNRVVDKINSTDGIGLVVAGGIDSTSSSRSFSLAFAEELKDSIASNIVKKPVIDNIVKNSAERILGRKDIKSLADYEKLLKLTNTNGGLTFEQRESMVQSIGAHENKKLLGILSWNDVMKKYQIQNGDFQTGQIMSVIQFKKGAPLIKAADLGIKEHKSYEAVIQGHPLGMLTEKVMIADFFKDFLDAEGTLPKNVTRKVQTKMPSFKYGEGSAVFPKSSAESISSVAKMK